MCLETIFHGEYVSLNFKLAFSIEKRSHSDSSEGRTEMAQGSGRLLSPFTHSFWGVHAERNVGQNHLLLILNKSLSAFPF